MDIKKMQQLALLAQKKHQDFEKQIFNFSEQGGLIKGTISGKYKITLDIDLVKFLEEVGDQTTALGILQTTINNQIEEIRKKERKVLSGF